MNKQIENTIMYEDIVKLMTVMGQEVVTTPTIPSLEIIKLRHRLIAEENDEMLEAALKGDLIEVGDGLTDLMVVLLGAYVAYGFTSELGQLMFDEVQASNLSKLGLDGKPIKREDGKFLKGPNYFKPNLKKVIEDYLESKSEGAIELPIMSKEEAEKEFFPAQVKNENKN